MIRLVIDSTFGVSKQYTTEHNIEVVNLKMILDGESTKEGFEEDWASFYNKMKSSKSFPSTSQPSPQDFMNAIDKILFEDSSAQIIVLTIATALSGTLNGATVAVNSYNNKNIVAVDSMQATTCGRIMVEELIEAIDSGKSFEEVLQLITVLQQNLKIQFIPDNMENLKRGGRIGSLSATIASILKIKPIFCFEHNKISVPKKSLGFNMAINELVKMIPKAIKKLYICYVHDMSNVKLIVDKVTKLLGRSNVEVVSVSPVFGVHVGIGAVGIASLGEY